MKKYIIIILLLNLHFVANAQKPNGLYIDDNTGSFICVKDDSISIGYGEPFKQCSAAKFYYGQYRMIDYRVTLVKNLMSKSKVFVKSEHTDYQGVEIAVFNLYKNFNIGAPGTNDSMWYVLSNYSELFLDFIDTISNQQNLNRVGLKAKNGIIQIPIDTLRKFENSEIECLIDCYRYIIRIPLSMQTNVRYLLKERYPSDSPLDIEDLMIIYDKCSNSFYTCFDDGIPHICHLKRKCRAKSCLDELRRYYSDL